MLLELVSNVSTEMEFGEVDLVLDTVEDLPSPLHSIHLLAHLRLKRLVRVSLLKDVRS